MGIFRCSRALEKFARELTIKTGSTVKCGLRIQGAEGSRVQVKMKETVKNFKQTLEPWNPRILEPYFRNGKELE